MEVDGDVSCDGEEPGCEWQPSMPVSGQAIQSLQEHLLSEVGRVFVVSGA